MLVKLQTLVETRSDLPGGTFIGSPLGGVCSRGRAVQVLQRWRAKIRKTGLSWDGDMAAYFLSSLFFFFFNACCSLTRLLD